MDHEPFLHRESLLVLEETRSVPHLGLTARVHRCHAEVSEFVSKDNYYGFGSWI